MSGYLDDFGASDARREAIFKRIIAVAVIVASVGGILYFQFRNFREERRVKSFLQLVESKDYEGAYALWGCSVEAPCPGYSYTKFLEDWGPESEHPDISLASITRTRSCDDGIFQTLSFGEEDEIWLWVGRSDRVIGYAPWPMCNPRLPKSEIEGP